VLGFDSGEVVLQADPGSALSHDEISMPQWHLEGLRIGARDRRVAYAGDWHVASNLVVTADVRRRPLFMLRLVVLPLLIIVVLSWSVFWMDRSSVGDRISVSFVGILTAVAFQILMADVLPQISYATWMNGLVSFSFIVMSATVVVNLVVGTLDKAGNHALGDLIDRRSRWIFPIVYFGFMLASAGIAVAFP
jgi:hypothetical protein